MSNDNQHSDFEDLRKSLIAKRVRVGALTPVGRRISNLIEQLENFPKAESDSQRENLRAGIARSIKEIDDLMPPHSSDPQ
jgi:hypothetical protein